MTWLDKVNKLSSKYRTDLSDLIHLSSYIFLLSLKVTPTPVVEIFRRYRLFSTVERCRKMSKNVKKMSKEVDHRSGGDLFYLTLFIFSLLV
jgi:hypothetical protein